MLIKYIIRFGAALRSFHRRSHSFEAARNASGSKASRVLGEGEVLTKTCVCCVDYITERLGRNILPG